MNVPRELMERISDSLAAFCSDEGWSQADMDVLDSVSALLAQDAAASAPRCACCGTTENLHLDPGSGGPYRCDSDDCVVY